MATQIVPAPKSADHPTLLSAADRAAHDASTHVRRPYTVLAAVVAGHPRGHLPAEEYAAARRAEGIPAEVVMDYDADAFLIIVREAA